MGHCARFIAFALLACVSVETIRSEGAFRFTIAEPDSQQHGARLWIQSVGPANANSLRPRMRVLQWNILAEQVTQAQTVTQLVKFGESHNTAEDICAWSNRLPLIVDTVRQLQPDIITFQEVGDQMWLGLRSALAVLGYDGRQAGYVHGRKEAEYGVAVLWHNATRWRARAENVELLANLPECKDICQTVEGNKQNHRAVSVALESVDGLKLAVVTVHPNWKGPEAVRVGQVSGALSVSQRTAEQAGWQTGRFSVLLCGDLNTTPDRHSQHAAKTEGPVMYNYLTAREHLQDVYTIFPGAFIDDESRFTHAAEGKQDEIIDYIFHTEDLTPVGVLQIAGDGVLQGKKNLPRNGYPSDHVHLACDLEFNGPDLTAKSIAAAKSLLGCALSFSMVVARIL